MLATQYDAANSRLLATTVLTAAGGKVRAAGRAVPSPVLEVGGGWERRTWRGQVQQLVRNRRAAVVTLRALPAMRVLKDSEWSQVVADLASRGGLDDRPWVAVRMGPRAVTLVTDSAAGRLPTEPLRDATHAAMVRYGVRVRPAASPASGTASGSPQPDNPEQAKDSPRGIAAASFAAAPTASDDVSTTAPTVDDSARRPTRQPRTR